MMKNQDIKSRIKNIAESYRLHKNSDISLDCPDSLVLELIAEAIQRGETTVIENFKDNEVNITYYPEHSELSKVINIHMYSRIQNSNSHHYKIRGQWFVRNGLEKVAMRLAIQFKDIISK